MVLFDVGKRLEWICVVQEWRLTSATAAASCSVANSPLTKCLYEIGEVNAKITIATFDLSHTFKAPVLNFSSTTGVGDMNELSKMAFLRILKNIFNPSAEISLVKGRN